MVCPPIPCRPPLPFPRSLVPRSLPDRQPTERQRDQSIRAIRFTVAQRRHVARKLRVPNRVCPPSHSRCGVSPLASNSRQQTTLHHAPTAGPRHHDRSGDTIPKPARARSAIRQSQARHQPAGAASDFFSSAPAPAPSAAGSAFAGAAVAAAAGPAPRPAFKASS